MITIGNNSVRTQPTIAPRLPVEESTNGCAGQMTAPSAAMIGPLVEARAFLGQDIPVVPSGFAASRVAEHARYRNHQQMLAQTEIDRARRYLGELSSSTRSRCPVPASPSNAKPRNALPARTADCPRLAQIRQGRPTARSLPPPTPHQVKHRNRQAHTPSINPPPT